MKKTGAIIVAAGLSSRMKEFKPMLTLGDTSIISRVINTMKVVGAEPILVVTGYKADILEKHITHMGVICIKNERYAETQMFDSVKLGMSYIQGLCDRILLVPADVPLINAVSVKCLLEQEDAQIVCPVYKQTAGHPLLLSAKLIPRLLEYDGDGGLRKAIEHLGFEIKYIEVEDEGVLLDADTPEDYLRLLRKESELNGNARIRYDIQLRIFKEEIFFGPGAAQFLELVDRRGSMQAACTCMNLSYSKGWKMVNNIERQLGFRVLTRITGGIDGGGSSLTEQGRKFLNVYLQFQEEVKQVTEQLYMKYFGCANYNEGSIRGD